MSNLSIEPKSTARKPFTIKVNEDEKGIINGKLSVLKEEYPEMSTAELLVKALNSNPVLPTPEIKEVTVEVKVPIELLKNQFLIQFEDETVLKARKCRSFMKSDKKLTQSDDLSQLVNIAVKYYLENEYNHVLNPILR